MASVATLPMGPHSPSRSTCLSPTLQGLYKFCPLCSPTEASETKQTHYSFRKSHGKDTNLTYLITKPFPLFSYRRERGEKPQATHLLLETVPWVLQDEQPDRV